jgi:hypothetical protein
VLKCVDDELGSRFPDDAFPSSCAAKKWTASRTAREEERRVAILYPDLLLDYRVVRLWVPV